MIRAKLIHQACCLSLTLVVLPSWAQSTSLKLTAPAITAPTPAAPTIAVPLTLQAPGVQPSAPTAGPLDSSRGGPDANTGPNAPQKGSAEAGPSDLPSQASNLNLPELGTTTFQQFVLEASGKLLPLHGYNLFFGNRFPSLTNVPVPANYVIGPGDEIDIKIWGMTDMSFRAAVDRNGQISIPKVGTFTIAGTRSDQLENALKSQIEKVLRHIEINATVGRLRSVQIFMVGHARKPGAYMVSSLSTLIGALFETGGPAATGSMRKIQLLRGGKTVTTLDLYHFIHSGDTGRDARLLPGDVIVIPPAGPRVALTGALENPAIFELSEAQEPLSQLLDYAGGQQTLTSPHKVQLERIDAQQPKAARSVQTLALDTAGLAYPVRAGDVLTLFRISPEFSNAVTLRGNVASPLRYAHQPGMKVSDLIPEMAALIQADYYVRKNRFVQYESGQSVSSDRVIFETRGLLEEINWEYATIERADLQKIKTLLIPFNLGKAIRQKDPAHNLLLQPGDVVTIYGVKDLPVPSERRTKFVRVSGEVQVPGVYEIKGNETLTQLIQRAGGLTSNAYLYGTVLSRESARIQQQENLKKAVQRMEAAISSQTSSLIQNTSDNDKGVSLQMQLASQRSFLERLRGLQATGRVSLELDPLKPILPDLLVEDSDHITVPKRSDFVGIYGAVLADASMIHRPGHTLSDYLAKAGVSRDADMDEIMLIRANGMVENQSGSPMRSFFGGSLLSKPLYPGDTVFVPEVVDRRTAYTQFIQGMKDWTQILYQMGLGAAAIKTLRP